jgi:chemotaxis protein methyltransferase CheR
VVNEILPEVTAASKRGERQQSLKIWHAGCSSGEEPYSLSWTLANALGHRDAWDIRQIASDINTDVLAAAARGVYNEDRLSDIPLETRRRMFLKGSGEQSHLYKIRPELQADLSFKRINLLAEDWPIRPDIRFDMIWCRNVVIYFDKETQKRLFARFVQRLKPGGFLFIGHSESLLGISDSFESVGQTIYRPRAASNVLGKAA